MCFILSVLFVQLALAVFASATPQAGYIIQVAQRSPVESAAGSFNPNDAIADVRLTLAMIRAGFQNYEKNFGKKHPYDAQSVTKRGKPLETESIMLDDYKNKVWSATINVGTPSMAFSVAMDIVFSDVLLPSINCDSSCNGGHAFYNYGSSSTAHKMNRKFVVGDTPLIVGDGYTDKMIFCPYIAINQTLGGVTHYASELAPSNSPAGGRLGIGFQSISAFNTTPFLQTIVPAFSFKIKKGLGELYFDGVDPLDSIGETNYLPVTTPLAFWQVKADGIWLNEKEILKDLPAIIDISSSYVIGPLDQVSSLHLAIDGSARTSQEGIYLIPCDSFPSIRIVLGGTSFPILTSALNLGPVEPGSSMCVSGIVGGHTGPSGLWVLGHVFLQGVDTTFDFGHDAPRVGFSQLS